MSRDKQIEEMAKALNGCTANCTDDCGCSEMEHAEVLYNAGYRKSTDVAEEIFAEIDKLLAVDRNGEANLDVRALQRLKKKYTEE